MVDVVQLDVGGSEFCVERQDLLRVESFFSVLVSDDFASEVGADGTIFVDRDPTHFPDVLAMLRWQQNRPSAHNLRGVKAMCAALGRELHFYGLGH